MNKEEKRLDLLRTLPYSKMTISDINFLEKQGVINGVWPSIWWKWLRVITTKMFSFLDWKRHDVWFWQQIGFHLANWGILKYSFVSIAKDYRDISNDKWYRKLYRVPKYHITLPFKTWIIWWAYNAVESSAWKKAYESCKDI